MSGNRTIDGVPLALLETIEKTWRQADEFSAKANEAINDGLWRLRTFLESPAVICHGCMKDTKDPNHFDEAGKCGFASAQTNTSGKAHCPHCAVCHTAEETCIQALRRVLALYEPSVHGKGGEAQCA